MIDLDEPRLTLNEIGAACDFTAATIRTWVKRGHIKYLETEGGGRPGVPHRLSLRSALTIGATAALVRAGIDAQNAAPAAIEWTHLGEGPLPGRPALEPCGLYVGQQTILAVYGDHQARVHPAPLGGVSLQAILEDAQGRRWRGCTFVILNDVHRAIMGAVSPKG